MSKRRTVLTSKNVSKAHVVVLSRARHQIEFPNDDDGVFV
jgi:hypothetical protein